MTSVNIHSFSLSLFPFSHPRLLSPLSLSLLLFPLPLSPPPHSSLTFFLPYPCVKVEKSLDSPSATVRQKGISVLRNLMAKLDSDERFSTPVS